MLIMSSLLILHIFELAQHYLHVTDVFSPFIWNERERFSWAVQYQPAASQVRHRSNFSLCPWQCMKMPIIECLENMHSLSFPLFFTEHWAMSLLSISAKHYQGLLFPKRYPQGYSSQKELSVIVALQDWIFRAWRNRFLMVDSVNTMKIRLKVC